MRSNTIFALVFVMAVSYPGYPQQQNPDTFEADGSANFTTVTEPPKSLDTPESRAEMALYLQGVFRGNRLDVYVDAVERGGVHWFDVTFNDMTPDDRIAFDAFDLKPIWDAMFDLKMGLDGVYVFTRAVNGEALGRLYVPHRSVQKFKVVEGVLNPR